MNTYRFSGLIEGHLCQVDIEAENVSEAKKSLIEQYEDFESLGVSKL